MKEALVVMDYVNEIVHPDGKFKGKGYAQFVRQHGTLDHVVSAVESARKKAMQIVFVKVGFSEDYSEQPKGSPLFGKANEFQALKLGTWATEFHEALDVQDGDFVVTKHRVSPFRGTNLHAYLKGKGVTDLYLCGVATDLVVQSAAREAHDMDYAVHVLSDCCAAGSIEDHEDSLRLMTKIAKVGTLKELLQDGI